MSDPATIAGLKLEAISREVRLLAETAAAAGVSRDLGKLNLDDNSSFPFWKVLTTLTGGGALLCRNPVELKNLASLLLSLN